jgi:hypothetical protein
LWETLLPPVSRRALAVSPIFRTGLSASHIKPREAFRPCRTSNGEIIGRRQLASVAQASARQAPYSFSGRWASNRRLDDPAARSSLRRRSSRQKGSTTGMPVIRDLAASGAWCDPRNIVPFEAKALLAQPQHQARSRPCRAPGHIPHMVKLAR